MQNWTHKIPGIALGNTLVLYDYILYGFLGSTLSKLFFPYETQLDALMSVFIVFASACLVRPLATFIFGLIGDKYGRKSSLIISIIMMTLSSFLIGCLPTYNSIGNFSVVLLVTFRIIQGFSMSGEEVGSAIYLIESAPDNRKSLAGSIVLACGHIGLLIGATMILICVSLQSPDQFLSWGWRIPFFLSLPIGLVVLYYRFKQADSTDFSKIKHNRTFAFPMLEVFRLYKKQLVVGIFVTALAALAIYLFAVYVPNFLKLYHHYTTPQILIFTIICFIFSAIAVITVGHIGDRIGSVKPLAISAIVYLFTMPIIFWLLSKPSIAFIIIAQILLIVTLALCSGTLMLFLTQLFPVKIRFTGVAICFNFSMVIFGSTAPVAILYLHKISNWAAFPAIYLMFIAVIAYFLLRSIKHRLT